MIDTRLLTGRELSKQIGIGASTIYLLARQGKIPSYRVGETGVRFRLDEVLEALRRPAVGA